jgi:hypothetical protein
MHCTQCGVANQDTARFCQSCGAALAAAESAALVPAPVRTSPTLVAALVVACVLLLLVLTVLVTVTLKTRAETARMKAITGELHRMSEQLPSPAPSPSTEPEPSPSPAPAVNPVSADDPVAEAQVVLENYLAADLGHDGNGMRKYLGGQAAARFVPEVQGQENLTVHSQQVSGHTVKDDNTIVFSVEVKWSPEGSSEVSTQTDRYVVKRTEEGWKITSTPAYPE